MSDQPEIKIIKKVFKKGGHAHHGGAWKIAYADFVTAMMAFFMLMWLINTVTVEQKKGIADYFTPNFTKINGGEATDQIMSPKNGSVITTEARFVGGKTQLHIMKAQIEKAIVENKLLKSMMENIHVDVTSDALTIDIRDTNGKSMFVPGGIEMRGHMKDILNEVAKILSESINKLSITGHTDAVQYTNTKDYSNWELSVDRANATRKWLEKSGVDQSRMLFIKGNESNELFDANNPASPKNRRITIALLK